MADACATYSPSLWPGGPDPYPYSDDPTVARKQEFYPLSPALHTSDRVDLDAASAHLEAEAAKIAAMYPRSVPRMLAPQVNHIVGRVDADIRRIDAELGAQRAAVQAERQAAAPPTTSAE